MATSAPTSEGMVQVHSLDTAPHSKLPIELLAEIFRFLTPNPFKIPWQPDERDLPWTLFCVSTKWRSIALELPELWNNISIEYEKGGSVGEESDSKEVTRMAHKILSRSGSVPLSLSIKAVALDWEIDNWAPVVDLVTLHAHRIRHLDLYLHEEILWELLDSPPLDFEYLESLSLASTDDECTDEVSEVFQKAPRLRVADLDLCFVWSSATPELPWANLTDLTITRGDDLSPAIAHRVIRQCPSLTILQVTLWSDDEMTDSNIPPMTYLSLKTLLVQLEGCTMMAVFLKPLILPCLTRLELTYPDDLPYVSSWDHAAALSVIPSYKQLNNLSITLPIPDDYNLESFFKSCPNLTELRFPPLSQSTLLLLSSGEWLPKLQVLEVSVTSMSLGTHVSMLNNRAEGGCSTRGIFVWCTRKDRKEFKADVREEHLINKLKDRGLLRLTRSSPRRETSFPLV